MIRRLVRAVAIGFATIFAIGADHERHWSTPTTMQLHVEDGSQGNGTPQR